MAVDWSEIAYKLAKKKINEKNQIDAEEFFFVVSLLGDNDFNKECVILKGFQERKIDIFFKNIHEDLYSRYRRLEGKLRIHNLLYEKSEHIKELINKTKDTTKWRNQLKEVERKHTEEE